MINPKNLGLAAGIFWGVSMFILTILSMYTGYANAWLVLTESFYPGYTISWSGSILGLIYGFLDGFIGLYILAWLYNKLNA